MNEDLLRKLLISFQAEYRDHLEKIRGLLPELEKPDHVIGTELEEVFRRAHSLKGAARAVDLHAVETLAHCVETIFSRIREHRIPLQKDTFKTIHLVLDAIEDWIVVYLKGDHPAQPVKALNAVETLLGTEVTPRPSGKTAPTSEMAPVQPISENSIQISAESLEHLLGASNRVFGETQALEIVSAKFQSLDAGAQELDGALGKIKKLGFQLNKRVMPDFSALRHHMDFIETKVRFIKREVRETKRLHGQTLWELRQAGEHLRSEVQQVRMIPAENIYQGFRKMVRDLAKDEDKQVEFYLEGLRTEADRFVLQALKDPLMHLLRNSISHGIEKPEPRSQRGKPPVGVVSLKFRTQGNLLQISLQDDGNGVDWKAVREYAARRNFLSQQEAILASTEELSRLLFQPGFSTARMVTDLSGRGMGLSVVAEAVKRLQGRLDLQSILNQGTTITLSVPLSISTHHLLVIRCAEQNFAIPLSSLEGLTRISIDQVETLEGKLVVTINQVTRPILNLAEVIGIGESPLRVQSGKIPVLLLKAPSGGLALAVDELVTELNGIIKNLSAGAERVKTFYGAVLMNDGSPVLVLDPLELIERARLTKSGPVLKTQEIRAAKHVPVILVADDSVTTRTLEKGILEAHGYQVILAVDGEEALQKLGIENIDLAIVDLQMPKMDGFSLIEKMKKDPRLAKLPVIIVSSLESREEKERGLSLGADAYIVKRKFDHKGLLETVRQIL